MAENITNNPAPDWTGFQLRGCGFINVDASIFDAGHGFCAGLQTGLGYFDVTHHAGLDYQRATNETKFLRSQYTNEIVVAHFGRTVRSDRDNVATTSSHETRLGIGSQSIEEGAPVDGVSNGVNDSRSLLYIASRGTWGLELRANKEFIISPFIGYELGVVYPFNVDEHWPGNSRNLSLLFGINVGGIDDNKEPMIGRPPAGLDIAEEFADDALNFLLGPILGAIQYDSKIAKGEGLVSETIEGASSGGTGQQSEDIPFWKGISSVFGAQKITTGIKFYSRVKPSNPTAAGAKLVVAGLGGSALLIGGLAGGAGYEGLIETGSSGLQTVAGALLSDTDTDRRLITVMRLALGLLPYFEAGAISATISPNPTEAGGLIEASTYGYAYETTSGRGAITVRNNLLGPMETFFQATSPAIGPGDVRKRGENAKLPDGKPGEPYDLTPTRLRYGVGIGEESDPLKDVSVSGGLGAYALRDVNDNDRGAGAYASVNISLRLTPHTALIFGVTGLAEMSGDKDTSRELQVGIGLTSR